MRIVAGQWRGRVIVAPKGESTRPTSDRVREAIFGSLTSRLGPQLGGPDARVFDAFAGSGAMALEALSRGAGSAVLVDGDRTALAALRSNIDALGAGTRARVVVGDAFRLAHTAGLPGGPFTLLLVDPPYRIDAGQVGDLVDGLLSGGMLADGAVVVYEHEARTEPVWPAGFEPLGTRKYGSTAVSMAKTQGGAG
jgi:16S rRNA (guanine966-N2)-methyltransferase